MPERMKRFALFSAAIALLNGGAVFCQDTPLCNMPGVPTQPDVLPLRYGGLYVSSTGVLKGLMIFVSPMTSNQDQTGRTQRCCHRGHNGLWNRSMIRRAITIPEQ